MRDTDVNKLLFQQKEKKRDKGTKGIEEWKKGVYGRIYVRKQFFPAKFQRTLPFSLEEATKAQGESRGIALLFL